jgi:hypothetical protein
MSIKVNLPDVVATTRIGREKEKWEEESYQASALTAFPKGGSVKRVWKSFSSGA